VSIQGILDVPELTCHRSLRPLFLSLWPGNQREVDRLREMREGLSNDISDIIGASSASRSDTADRSRRRVRTAAV
jgi:hypothetical protein